MQAAGHIQASEPSLGAAEHPQGLCKQQPEVLRDLCFSAEMCCCAGDLTASEDCFHPQEAETQLRLHQQSWVSFEKSQSLH